MDKKGKGISIKRIIESKGFSQILPIIILVIMIFVFQIATGGAFTAPASLKIIVESALIVATVATGATFIFATGNVSLSMGATTVLTATLAGLAYNATGSFVVMLVSAVAIGIFIMTISALLSTALGIRIIFVTIVMMTLLTAIQQSILGGSTVSVSYEFVSGLASKGFMYIAFIIYFVISIIFFHLTSIGRSLRFIGVNNTCAEQTGISKSKYLVIAFIIAGAGCGVGALLAIVRAGSIGTNTLTSLNMDCMLALVLGGMSIFGGSRSFAYSGVVGAVIVTVLNQGLLMVGVDSTIIQAVRGIAFLVLITLSQVRPKGLPAPEG